MFSKTIATLTVLLACGAASAQGYGIASVGVSTIDEEDCTGGDPDFACDSRSVAFKLGGGYKFTPNLAGELLYLNFGKFAITTTPSSPVQASAETKSAGIGGALALHLDLAPNWSATARLGVLSMKTDGLAVGNGNSLQISQRKAVPYVGLSAGYAVAQNVVLEGGWDYSQAKVDLNGQSLKTDMNAFNAGVRLSF